MRENKGSRKGIRTIVAATTMLVLSLLSAFGGTFAWFMSTTNQQAEASQFQCTALDAKIESVQLYKFKYYEIDEDLVNYLAPEDGEVKSFNFDPVRNEFGETVESVWKPETVMNLYDPVSLIIGGTLEELNCNAIYKITLQSATISSGELKVFAKRDTTKEKANDQIFLTDCADFDYFFPSDLDAVTNRELYYPEYINPAEDLSAAEEVYYKISYLASQQEGNHAHFYGGQTKPDQIPLHDPENIRSITFNNGFATFYVNVNYAPSQLEQYAIGLSLERILAVYDFVLAMSME